MFFFGLLSSHLPYVILGILYVVSFGLISVRVLTVNDVPGPEVRQWSKSSQNQSKLEQASTFHFVDHISFQETLKAETFELSDIRIYRIPFQCFKPPLSLFARTMPVVHQFGRPPTS